MKKSGVWAIVLSSSLVINGLFFPVSARTLAEIQSSGRLIVGVKDNLRPLGYRNEQGQLQGFEIDLAHQLAQELLGDENAVDFVPVSNQNRLAMVYNQEVDIVVAGVSLTESRLRVVNLSLPYYQNSTSFITLDSSLTELNQLHHVSIAILEGSDTFFLIQSLFPAAHMILVNSYQSAKDLLDSGQVQAFAGDTTILTGWVQDYPQYHRLQQTLGGELLSIVMPKGLQYRTLRDDINHIVDRLKNQGWLQEHQQKWGL